MKLHRLFAAGAMACSLLALGAGQVLAQPAHDETVIEMAGNKFATPNITVPAGASVTWLNTDGEQHDVIEFNFTFESPLINPGETWTVTFDTPGTYKYVCDLHANMEGTITVTA